MRTRKLQGDDLRWLRDQPGQEELGLVLDDLTIQAVVNSPRSYTVEREDGVVMLCGGLLEYWNGRAETWASFNKREVRKDFLAVHHQVEKFLDESGFRRIEAAVVLGFENGHRWVKALGFRLEAPVVRKYLPNGKDCSLYARIMD